MDWEYTKYNKYLQAAAGSLVEENIFNILARKMNAHMTVL